MVMLLPTPRPHHLHAMLRPEAVVKLHRVQSPDGGRRPGRGRLCDNRLLRLRDHAVVSSCVVVPLEGVLVVVVVVVVAAAFAGSLLLTLLPLPLLWPLPLPLLPFAPACAECSGRHDATDRANGPNRADSSESGNIVRGVCAVADIERIDALLTERWKSRCSARLNTMPKMLAPITRRCRIARSTSGCCCPRATAMITPSTSVAIAEASKLPRIGPVSITTMSKGWQHPAHSCFILLGESEPASAASALPIGKT